MTHGFYEPLMGGGTHGGGRKTDLEAQAGFVHGNSDTSSRGFRHGGVRPPGLNPMLVWSPPWRSGGCNQSWFYLQPGLLIGDKPPEGWSHLVVKSIPRLASGEKDSLPNGSAKTAAYFRTVILANVKPVDVDEKEFELTQIGIGICVPRKGEEKDVVVAADRLEALGLHLSWVEKKVLDTL